MDNVAFARRAILRKSGSSDVRFAIQRIDALSFEVFQNDQRISTFWRSVSPQQAIRGDSVFLSLDDAWNDCLAKRFPDYEVVSAEDAFPVS
jgi:hypothetical protein